MNLNSSTQQNLYKHQEIFKHLSKLYLNNKLPNKILLSGEKGIGKATLGYHLINFVLSVDEEHSYDVENNKINLENKSFKLIQNKSNPNFNLIDVAENKKNIDINQIRELIVNLNKSSFNNKKRFVLIDNIELLNLNSINALLKVLEEPNKNINFILINNNKRVLPTLKSRCLNFKIFLTNAQSIEIVNKLINDDVYNFINQDLVNYFTTPGKLYELLKLAENFDLDLKDYNLDTFLQSLISSKNYKKNKPIIQLIYSFIEVYFRNNISTKNIKLFHLYHYFLKKINDTKIYNLDEETLFMEFEDKVLNG
ncbi:DNA polymerase III [Candidatus Pelagibacter communis]|uniref:DNA polymerase III n=1 Tax=Pelagibacter ubique TaxID=198252 RepID=UPI00065B4566|nr:DNA polymerase III [Candidatus Pelagibacter ubique]